ncbi:MAG: AMP-binding protein, partial [Mycobacterium sp.]|nr:AMP-binding protein [Mycobacterium sp.]
GDTMGEIMFRGNICMKGYLKNERATEESFRGGWFHTGDLGSLDAAGRLSVLGRTDEAINSGGLTILPGPVEAVLGRHPAVAECAVFAVPDDRLGQRVAVAVVPAQAGRPPTLAELREFLADSLDPNAAPRELHIVDALPRLGIGKLDRRALRERCSQHGPSDKSVTSEQVPDPHH